MIVVTAKVTKRIVNGCSPRELGTLFAAYHEKYRTGARQRTIAVLSQKLRVKCIQIEASAGKTSGYPHQYGNGVLPPVVCDARKARK
jgi:hypothetical protein